MGWRMEQGVGFRRGFSRPRCMNGWADGMAVGNHGLETCLSEMWGKLRKYPPPHRFEAVLSVQGYHGHFACRDFTGGGSFRVHCNFGIARCGLTWRELSEHNETKIYLKYFGLTRRGLKRREFRSTIDRDASLNFRHNKARLEISEEQA